ncbi:carbonic anhydrase 1-like [Oppia nitens]|nr:carbonic anhydrase 1-like [Oppia nitens]
MCSSGSRQSPINIETNNLKVNVSLAIEFIGYKQPVSNLKLINNGITATLLTDIYGDRLAIGGSALGNDIYNLGEIHLHWGPINSIGSEHSLNNHYSSAEVHFVHYNRRYGIIGDAQSKLDGIVIVAAPVRLSIQPNIEFNTIVESRPMITPFGATVGISKPIILDRLLPKNRKIFFLYNGSQTEPPCNENVRWIILYDKIDMTNYQINQFRNLFGKPVNGSTKSRILFNRREKQSLNNRTVWVSIADTEGLGITFGRRQ